MATNKGQADKYKEVTMTIAVEKVAYSVAFHRLGYSMQFIEYRPEDELGWNNVKQRIAKKLSYQTYQSYCDKFGYTSYTEHFYSQEEVDNLSQSHDTGYVSKRALGIDSDEQFDFKSD